MREPLFKVGDTVFHKTDGDGKKMIVVAQINYGGGSFSYKCSWIDGNSEYLECELTLNRIEF